jgi:micrococcal nuclease
VDEFICFQNADGNAVDLTEWYVKDQAGNRYAFPPFTLAGGAYVRLHTGIGVNSSTDLYWGSPREVWNNSGDIVYLYDKDSLLVERYQY